MRDNIQDVIGVVEAVRAYEEAKGFFTEDDKWMFHAVLDYKLCDQCLSFAQTMRYRGDELKDKFPYLEVVSSDKIMANIHNHCRCFLTRM